MNKTIIAISNHGSIIGGGEHSFLDFLSHLPTNWRTLAVVPKKGELGAKLYEKKIETRVIPLPAIRLRFAREIISCFISYFNLLKKRRPKLIYANGSRAALYGGIIGKLFNIPVIWHCRIAMSDFVSDKILSKLCDRIIVNSNATALRFGQEIRHKVEVIHNGIDISWFEEQQNQRITLIDSDWKVILMVARVSREKRHDLAISSFEKLAALDPEIHIIFLGNEDEQDRRWWERLQEMTRRSYFNERIHWIGYVEDLRKWYHSATLLLLPSDNEAFGRVLVEAMACKLPVVGVKSGGIPEIVRNWQEGILVRPGRAEYLAEAMGKILNNDSLKERFSYSAKNRAQEFDLNIHIKKVVEVFEKVINGQKLY